MNTQALIDGIVQQTTVLIAHLATAGGIRAPLARIANRVFLDLGEELHRQGVKKNVIADMFGMALRTYHRRVRSVAESETDAGHTVWDAVLEFIHEQQPVGQSQVKQRFRHDEPSVVSGVLNDLVSSGFVYRSGRGEGAVFRIAEAQDFERSALEHRREANEYIVWLSVYRHGPIGRAALAELTRLLAEPLERALATLLADGRIEPVRDDEGGEAYRSARFDVPLGASLGWEAAVLDHFQALVSAINTKLRGGKTQALRSDEVGGATYTLDVWAGHPCEAEARGLLAEIRGRVDALRERVDQYNAKNLGERSGHTPLTPVVFYAGQYIKAEMESHDDDE